jgi:hypothetical protein
MLMTGWAANPRPLGCCPQMTWGRTLKKALRSKALPTENDGDLFAGGHRSNRQLAPGTNKPYGRRTHSGREYKHYKKNTYNQPNRLMSGEQKQFTNTQHAFFSRPAMGIFLASMLALCSM